MSNKMEKGNLSFRFPNAPAKIASKHVEVSLRIDIRSRQEGHVSISAKLYCMKASF